LVVYLWQRLKVTRVVKTVLPRLIPSPWRVKVHHDLLILQFEEVDLGKEGIDIVCFWRLGGAASCPSW
jgi:hypothetical protein